MDSSYFITLILCFLMLLWIILYYYQKQFAPYNTLPYVPILKLSQTGKFLKEIISSNFNIQTLMEIIKDFQKDGLCLVWLYHPHLFIFGEEAIKCFSNSRVALHKSPHYHSMEDVFGKGLLTSNGDILKKHRKMLNPVFSTIAIKDKLPILNKQAQCLVKELSEIQGDSVNILDYLKFCAFSNVCESLIGIDMKDRKMEVEYAMKCITFGSNFFTKRFVRPWLYLKSTLHIFPTGRRYLKLQKVFRTFMAEILSEVVESTLSHPAIAEFDETTELDTIQRKSFAQILVDNHLKDSSVTLEYMVDELTTFILAGFDTVAYAMMWCLFLLGHHQKTQDRVYKELESVMENELTYNDLQKLPYLECVIKETLRLYSTVPVYARSLQESVHYGKYTIPKDTVIVFFSYMYHRNPEVYPDPETFYPERFLDENFTNRHIFFSEGLRNCIGKKFALTEMKITLAHLVRNFKVSSLDKIEDVKLSWEVVLSPLNPLRMRLTPRH